MEIGKSQKRRITLSALIIGFVGLGACAGTAEPAPIIKIAPAENAKLLGEQSSRVLALLNAQRNGKDIAISETGISKILDAVAKGADGDSYTQIRNFIKEKQLPLVNDKVYQNANVMYFRNIKSIYQDYIKALSDFVIEPSIEAINKKAAKITKGMIPDAMKNVSADSEVVLSNIMTFNAKWDTPFFDKSRTKKEDFTAQCGKPKPQNQVGKVATMHAKIDTHFVKDGDIRSVSLPFKDGYELVVVMSDDKTASPARASQWLYADGGKHINQVLYADSPEVILSLPKLDITSAHSLIPALSKQGVSDIFIEEKANLSKISSNPLFVNLFEQQVKFQADEEGAKAAAVTTVGMMLTSAMPVLEPPKPIVFDVDHAFAYVIVKKRGYHQIILAGEVNSLGICK